MAPVPSHPFNTFEPSLSSIDNTNVNAVTVTQSYHDSSEHQLDHTTLNGLGLEFGSSSGYGMGLGMSGMGMNGMNLGMGFEDGSFGFGSVGGVVGAGMGGGVGVVGVGVGVDEY